MFRLSFQSAVLALVLGGAALSPAQAGSINVATGLDGSNNLLTADGSIDAHWTTPGGVGAGNHAQIVQPADPDWFGGWFGDGPNSNWIARDASANRGNGLGTYTRTFDLTGYDLSTVSLSGSWAIDDAGILQLNGNTIGTLGGGAWGALTPFSVSAGSSDFVAGVNTLSITINSTDNFLEGVRLEGTVTGSESAVPEPGTCVMLGIGIATLASYGRRRRTVAAV